jgi:RimJ/RimL family protein N-acetyltransferase
VTQVREQPILQTERLLLRPFVLRDAPELTHRLNDPEIARNTLSILHPYDEEMAIRWIGTHADGWGRGELANFAITPRETGELIGAVGLMIEPRHLRAELGYWMGRDFWGQGYCAEAARVVVEFGMDGLGLNRIQGHHFSSNPASGRVMRKVGMRYEGHMRQWVRKEDRFEDADIYAILRSDIRP